MSKRKRGNGAGYYARYGSISGGAMKGYQQRQYKRSGGAFPPETKYFDTAVEAHVIGTAGDWSGTEVPCDTKLNSNGTTVGAYTSSSLIPSATGTGYGEVIANRYLLKKLRIKGAVVGQINQDQADVATGKVVRLVLVMDTNCDGAQAQGENIFTDFGTDQVNVHSFLNMGSTAGKFRILKDIRLMLNPAAFVNDHATNSSTNSNVNEGELFHMVWTPKKPLAVTLKGPLSTTAQTSQLQNINIFMLALTEENATVSFCCRAYFCE